MFHLIELVKLRGQQPFAYHYPSKDIRKIKDMHDMLFKKYGDFSISTHILKTNDSSWRSVYKMDMYFKDVLCIDNFKKFGEYLNYQTSLNSVDLCSYILRYLHESLNVSYISPKKMEKLLYLIYANFLTKTREKLFPQKFCAWDFGPVESYSRIAYLRDNLPSADKSVDKILCSNKMNVIFDNVNLMLEKYGNLSEDELIEITHRDGSPWSMNYEKGKNIPISDEDILNHSMEVI